MRVSKHRPGIYRSVRAKIGVGTALNAKSRVWFTLSHGIFNEIYYPQIDQACTRDLGLIVTDGHGFFSEEKRDARCALEWLEDGVPAFRLTNTHEGGRYRIEKEILFGAVAETLGRLRRDFGRLAGPGEEQAHDLGV